MQRKAAHVFLVILILNASCSPGGFACLFLLSKGEGFADTFAPQFDTERSLQLAEDLLVWNCLSRFILIDLHRGSEQCQVRFNITT